MNRRIFALLLAMVTVFAFAACKKNSVPEESIPGVVMTPGVDDGDLEYIPEEETKPAEKDTIEETENTAATEETAQSPDVEGTDPEETTATVPTEPVEVPVVPTGPAVQMTSFEWYNSLSGAEQMAFMQSFDSVPAFFDWYNNAKAEHAELHPDIEIGDGVIDLGDLTGGNG